MEKTLKLERLKAEEEGYEAEMIGWHQRLNGYEFEQTLGDSERQGSLVSVIHGIAESDMIEGMNNNNQFVSKQVL